MTVRSQLHRRLSKDHHTKQVLARVSSSSPQHQQHHKKFFIEDSTVVEYCTSSDEEHDDYCYQQQQEQQEEQDGNEIEVEYRISPSPFSSGTNRKRCDTSNTVTSVTSKGLRVSFGSIHVREYNRTINGISSSGCSGGGVLVVGKKDADKINNGCEQQQHQQQQDDQEDSELYECCYWDNVPNGLAIGWEYCENEPIPVIPRRTVPAKEEEEEEEDDDDKQRPNNLQQQTKQQQQRCFFLSPFHMFNNHRSIPTKRKKKQQQRPSSSSLSPRQRRHNRRDGNYERTPTTPQQRTEILTKFGFSPDELREAEEQREKIRLYRYWNVNHHGG
jgi:hypothetical protein